MTQQNLTEDKMTDRPFLATIRQMELGDSVTYPIERASYVRSACVSFGAEWGKKFATKTNRAERTITVTRTA